MLFLVPFAAASVAPRATPLGPISATPRRELGGGVRGVGGGFRDVPSRGILRGVRVVPAGVRDRDVPPERVSDAFRRPGATGARGGDGRRVAVRASRVVVDFARFQPGREFRSADPPPRGERGTRSRRGFRGVRRARPAALVPETRRKEVPAFPAGDVDVCVRGDRARRSAGAEREAEAGGKAATPRRAAWIWILDPQTLGTVARVSCVALNVRAAARDAQAAARRRLRVAQARGNHRHETRPIEAAAAFRAPTPRSAFW